MALQLNPALKPFWTKRARYRILRGGRASSKSHDAAGVAVYLASRYKLKFLCARQFQNKIAESVYSLLIQKIEAAGLQSLFVITKNSIKCPSTGSEFIFAGIARNLMEIKSMEDIDILWIEECAQMTEEQWKILEPTIRKEGSQIWLVFNPQFYTDFVYKRFVRNPPKNSVSRLINYDENPFLSNTMMDVILEAKAKMDPDMFAHIYLGEPISDNDRAIIQMRYLRAAENAHIKLGFEPSGSRRIGFDIADDGNDKNATCETYGNLVTGMDMWQGLEDELLKSCTRVYNRALELGSDIVYDSIGVGAGAGPKFGELNEARSFSIEYHAFHAGGAPVDPDKPYLELPHQTLTNRDFFSNVKSQAWWLVADRLRKTYEAVELGVDHPLDELICIDPNLPYKDELFEELTTPWKDVDLSGRVKVESKKDLAKRGIKSPNLADAFIDAFAPLEQKAGGFFDFF